MTFILTAVCVDCAGPRRLPLGPIQIEAVPNDADSWSRAGYLPGLARYLHDEVSGQAYYILIEEERGWKTSNPLFHHDDDGDEPAQLAIPREYRQQVTQLLQEFLEASPAGRALLISEFNGNVTSPDLEAEAADSIDVLGPMTLEEFWHHHDLGEVLEDSLTIIEAR